MGKRLKKAQANPPQMPIGKVSDFCWGRAAVPVDNLGYLQVELLAWYYEWIISKAHEDETFRDKVLGEMVVPHHHKRFDRSGPGAISWALRRLDERGYLHRVRSNGRTITGVILTDSGMAAAAKLASNVNEGD